MALESVVFQQDPFSSYGCKDFYAMEDIGGGYFGDFDHANEQKKVHDQWCSFSENSNNNNNNCKYNYSTPSMMKTNSSSPDEVCTGITAHGFFTEAYPSPAAAPPPAASRRKRRRIKSSKNKEEVENQRMTHIAVERNRRKQMNDYLAVLRSMMPPSYVQRGDQASIVGGAINYVKELEQLLQYLEARKQVKHQESNKTDDDNDSPVFANFFTFPQYSTRPKSHPSSVAAEPMVEKQSRAADIEVTMVESHANIKILAKRQPKQLFKMVSGFQSIGLMILHLNITTVDHRVLYSFNIKVEDDCQMTTVNEIATAVHEMVILIQEEAIFC